MSDIIDIQSIQTWPREISQFLKENKEIFLGWECSCCDTSYASMYDQKYDQLNDMLRNYSLIGYHCTKLTPHEIDEILKNGMSLQDLNTLTKRIDKLNENGFISQKVAEKLKNSNQANEENRANMLWFCFYEPFKAGQFGIYRFFDSWGGEALYNSHESNPKTGKILRNIGTPSIIKAQVPINKLDYYSVPVSNIVRAFLKEKRHSLDNQIKHEGFSIEDIPSENIHKIIQYPSKEFVELTRCDEWHYTIN